MADGLFQLAESVRVAGEKDKTVLIVAGRGSA